MASDQVLQTPQVLAEVFGYLEPPLEVEHAEKEWGAIRETQQELRRTLAAAARSSRVLSKHALTALWRRLDSMVPLIALFSKRERTIMNRHVTMMEADITLESWLRFQAHARRVRVLHAQRDSWSCIHPSTWAFVGQWCGTEPLLPNLEELSVLPLDVESPTMVMFISPKLRSLSLALQFGSSKRTGGSLGDWDEAAVKFVVRKIVSTAPWIKTLTLNSHGQELSPSCCYPFAELGTIQVLHAPDFELDFNLLRCIGLSASLYSLAARINVTDLPPQPEDSEDGHEGYDPFSGCFKDLKHLTVRGSSEHIHRFLDVATINTLETHSVEFYTESSPQIITRCVDAIKNNATTGQLVLRELTLKYSHKSYWEDEKGPVNAALVDVILPALSVRSLRKVTLEFQKISPFTLTNKGLLRMVTAWPELTELHIPSSCKGSTTRTILTPSVLVAVARSCPRLTELTLPPIPLDKVPEESDTPFVGHRALQTLRVPYHGRYALHELYSAALFIDRLFPCLNVNLLAKVPDHDPYHLFGHLPKAVNKEWRRIEEYLWAMQIGRRHGDMQEMSSGSVEDYQVGRQIDTVFL